MPATYPSIRYCDDPVFIVGAPRTSSSFWLTALVEAAEFKGLSEGHWLTLARQLDEKIVEYYWIQRQQGLLSIPRNVVARMPENTVRQTLFQYFRGAYDQLFDGQRWVDKTVNVEMIESLPYLLTVWPRGRVLYLKRNGISNVQSALAYFKVGFEECCLNWARCGEVWERVKPALPSECILEIDHQAQLNRPQEVAETVAKFLSLTPDREACLINFVSAKTAEWRQARAGEQTLDDVAWSASEKNLFYHICGRQMVCQGYWRESLLAEWKAQSVADDIVTIAPRSGRVLRAEEPLYCKFDQEALYVVPGNLAATTVLFERVRAVGMRHFQAELEVVHAKSQGVRFEFILCCRFSGAAVAHGCLQLGALQKRSMVLDFRTDSDEIDIFCRATKASTAEKNDYSWGAVRNLRLTA